MLSPINNTHKELIVNGIFVAYYISHINIKTLSVLTEQTYYTETKN
jgi:hypothetical protein